MIIARWGRRADGTGPVREGRREWTIKAYRWGSYVFYQDVQTGNSYSIGGWRWRRAVRRIRAKVEDGSAWADDCIARDEQRWWPL